jgi:hypothetical protein
MVKQFILVLISFAFVACTKSSDSGLGVSVQPNNKLDTLVHMSANVNGHLFTTDSVFGYNVQQVNNDSPGIVNLLITGTEHNADSVAAISITINNYIGPSVYNVAPPAVSASYYLNNIRHYATTGQITILSDTAFALIATFNFSSAGVMVNSGRFNVLRPF